MFLNFYHDSFSQLYFLCQLYRTTALLYLLKWFNYILPPSILQSKCSPSSLSQYITYLLTSAGKSLLDIPTCSSGNCTPHKQGKRIRSHSKARGRNELCRGSPARRNRSGSCRAALQLGDDGNGEKEPPKGHLPPAHQVVKEGFTAALHHSVWFESPSSRSALWNAAAEGKPGCYCLEKPWLGFCASPSGWSLSNQSCITISPDKSSQ